VNLRGLPIGVSQLVLNTPPFARLRLPPLDIGEFTPDIDLGTIVVGTGATLEATVRDAAGKARAGVSVRLDRGPGVSAADPDVAETDADGHASIGRLGPGRYRVRVGGDERPGGTGPFAEEWFRVSESDTRLERTFTAGGVSLEVTVATQAGPLQAARVFVMPGLGDAPEVEGFVVQTKTRLINAPFNPGIRSVTNEAGQATLVDVPPGPARLGIGLPGSTWSMPITVGVTDNSTNVLVPPAIAEVFVRDAVPGAGHLEVARQRHSDRRLRRCGWSCCLRRIGRRSGITRAREPESRAAAIGVAWAVSDADRGADGSHRSNQSDGSSGHS
jgi:hypothetical protein